MIYPTTNGYTKAKLDCNDQSLKKTWSQNLFCNIKKKIKKGNEKKTGKEFFSRDKSGKKSFFKKFGEANSLSDLK